MLKPTKAKNRELAFCVPWVPDAGKEKKSLMAEKFYMHLKIKAGKEKCQMSDYYTKFHYASYLWSFF